MLQIKTKITGERLDKQIPFALALALTKTAQDAQSAVVDSLRDTFTLRGRWFEKGNKFGIKIKAAKKTDLKASVHTQANWLELHETGGTKTPRGKELAIPTENVRRTKRDIIQKSQRPKALIGKRDFILNTKKGRVLFQRKGKGKRSKIVALYNLEPRATIKKQSTFFEPVEKVVSNNLQKNFDDALVKAYATAKR